MPETAGLRALPVRVRPFPAETTGSFLSRLGHANSIPIPHLLQLAGVQHHDIRSFSPATDDRLGWSEATPDQIATLAGLPLAGLQAALPALGGSAASGPPSSTSGRTGQLMRACPHCTAAKNIEETVLLRGRPQDYLCLRHRLWHRGLNNIHLAIVPEVVRAQRRHQRRMSCHQAGDIARALHDAEEIIAVWQGDDDCPALTDRWLERRHRLTGGYAQADPDSTAVATHPELLTVVQILLGATPHTLSPARVIACTPSPDEKTCQKT
jgi:hypothetical protein